MTTKDCTQGICSFYCPQWCYRVFPPPPPLQLLGDDSSSSGPNISPVVIAIIGVLASAFLLATYYAIISKFCRSSNPLGIEQAPDLNVGPDGDPSPGPDHEPWYVSTAGLDEALIRSIAVCKYKRGAGIIEGTCSVCLSEFQEDERVRLLPNCTHAFHISCIDTWLTSHTNCPLCRSEVAPTFSFPVLMPVPSAAQLPGSERRGDSENRVDPAGSASDPTSSSDVLDRGEATKIENHDVKSQSVRVFHNAENTRRTDAVIEVSREKLQPIRRSFSTGHWCQTVADILKVDQDEEDQIRESTSSSTNHNARPAKKPSEMCKIGHNRSFLQGVIDWHVPMKR